MLIPRLRAGGVDSVVLPIDRPGPIDPEDYRRRARGEGAPVERDYVAVTALRAIVLSGAADASALLAGAHALLFVVAGAITLEVPGHRPVTLRRGGMALVETGPVVSAHRDCRLIELALDIWDDKGDEPTSPVAATPRDTVNLKAMYRGDDDLAYFARLDQIFPATPDEWSEARPVTGLRFLQLEDQTFIDWHPEVVNQLVLVLYGELVLEVSGDHAVERFAAGDVCLAADRTGVGHTDRAVGVTAVGLAVMEDEHLWEPLSTPSARPRAATPARRPR